MKILLKSSLQSRHFVSGILLLSLFSISLADVDIPQEPVPPTPQLSKELNINIDGISKTEWAGSGLEGRAFTVQLQLADDGSPAKIFIPEEIADSIIGERLIDGLSAARFQITQTTDRSHDLMVTIPITLEYPQMHLSMRDRISLRNRSLNRNDAYLERMERKLERKGMDSSERRATARHGEW